MKRRILSLLICAFMVATMFVGCSPSSTNGENNIQKEDETFKNDLLVQMLDKIDLTCVSSTEFEHFLKSKEYDYYITVNDSQCISFEVYSTVEDYEVKYRFEFVNAYDGVSTTGTRYIKLHNLTMLIDFKTEDVAKEHLEEYTKYFEEILGFEKSDEGLWTHRRNLSHDSDEELLYDGFVDIADNGHKLRIGMQRDMQDIIDSQQ